MPGPVLRRTGERRNGSVRRLDLDRPLVDAALHDPRRFEALYRKYVAQVYSFAVYELRDHHAAEDATEAAFLRALVALPRFEERARAARDGTDASTFRVWLFRIARNVIANERRRARRHPALSLDPLSDGLVSEDAPLEAGAIRRDEAGAAWAAVARLPDDRRRALTLRFLHEMSTSEIAAVLGRSEGAVRVLIHRALRSVARDLDRRGRA
jgi:RNA polymerase sigma-70 factor (ECF subfamily)